MDLPRRRFVQLVAGGAVLATATRALCAEPYPTRPIRLVVPFPPGGAFDTLARPWVEKMKPLLGTMVVEKAADTRRSQSTAPDRRTRAADSGGGGLPGPDL